MTDIYNLSLAFAVTGVVLSIFCLILCAVQKASAEQKMTMLIIFCTLIIALGCLGCVSGTDTDLQVFSTKLEYLGIMNIYYAVFMLYLHYYKVKIKKWISYVLFLINALLSLFAASFDLHELFFKDYSIEVVNDIPHLVKTSGPLYYVYLGYVSGFTLAFTVFFIRQLIKKKYDHENTVLLYAVVMVPTVTYSIDKIFNPIMSFVPYGMIITDVTLIYLIIVRHFCDIDSLAQSLVFDSADDALIILDEQMCYVASNRLAGKMYHELCSAKKDMCFDYINPALSQVIKKCMFAEKYGEEAKKKALGTPDKKKEEVTESENSQNSLIQDIEFDEKIYSPSLKTVYNLENDKQVLKGYVLWLNDVTAERRHTRLQENYRKDLEHEVKAKTLQLQKMQEQMIFGFATLVENKNVVTGGHIKRTSSYVNAIGKELENEGKFSGIVGDSFVETLRLVAPLHDIGKISISEEILDKPGKLTPEEFEVIKTHSRQGADIIKYTMQVSKDDNFYRMAEDVAKYHHEKWDGTGYPDGLKGEEIPLSARIMAVADVFDALVSKRPYKKAYNMNDAFRIIKEGSGSHFDPRIVEAFDNIRPQIEELFATLKDDKTAFGPGD